MNTKLPLFILLGIILTFSITSVYALEQQCTIDLDSLQSDCDYNNIKIDANKLIGHGTINILFFEKEGCVYCKAVAEYLEVLKSKYDLNIIPIDVGASQQDLNLFVNTIQSFELDSYGVPVAVINNKIFLGENEIKERIEYEIKVCKEKGGCDVFVPKETDQKIGWWQVIALAIADAFNPCALSIFLILLSTVLLKYSKREVITHGLAFIVTIYCCYLLIGIAVIFSLKLASQYLQIGTITFMFLFCIGAIILGLLNLRDYDGGTRSEVPLSWRPLMKKLIKNVTSIWSAVIIAIILSFFLVPCIAGPYALVSGLLHNLSWQTTLPWLLLYNLIFVIPMIIIMFIVYFGLIEIDVLEAKRQTARKYIHLFASFILILMGILLLYKLYILSQLAFILALIISILVGLFIIFKR